MKNFSTFRQDQEVQEISKLTPSQRRKKAVALRKAQPKIKRAKALAAKRPPKPAKLKIRAQKAALLVLKQKMIGKGVNVASLSGQQKNQLADRLTKKFGKKLNARVKKIARKLLPKIKKQALADFKKRTLDKK